MFMRVMQLKSPPTVQPSDCTILGQNVVLFSCTCTILFVGSEQSNERECIFLICLLALDR